MCADKLGLDNKFVDVDRKPNVRLKERRREHELHNELTKPCEILRFRFDLLNVATVAVAAVDEHPFCLK